MSREPTGTYFDWLPVELIQYLSEFVTAGIPPAEYTCRMYHNHIQNGWRLVTVNGLRFVCPWCDTHVKKTHLGVCYACYDKHRSQVQEFAPIRRVN